MDLDEESISIFKEDLNSPTTFYTIQKRKFKQSDLLQQSHMEKSDKIVVEKLKKIAIISLIFMTIEIVGGALANSIAIMADAFHLFSDVVAYMVSLYAVLLSKKIAPKYLAFGYQKAQPLGALINVAIIWCVTIQLFIQATRRIISQQTVQQPLYMLLTSIFGLGCNLFIMKILHSSQDGHCGHDHGHSHGGHAHGNHQKQQKKHDHKKSKNNQHKCCSHKQLQIEAVCSCVSPDQISRTTGFSQSQTHSSKGVINHQSQIPIQLGQDLVPKRKHKGYCAIHSHDKHSHHDHHDHDHDHEHHDHSSHKHDQHDNHSHDNHEHNHQSHEHHDHSDHDHGHDHGHNHNLKVFENINIQAAYIHIISDIILSIGVIVSASIIFFVAGNDTQWTAWQLADPFCTYLFSVVALYSTISIVKQSFTILLDGCENPQLVRKLQYFIQVIQQKNKNVQIQQFRIWSSNRGKYYCTMKAIINKNTNISQHNQESQQQIIVRQSNDTDAVYQKIVNYCKQLKITCYIDTRKK